MGYASVEQIQTLRGMFDGFEEQVIEEVLVANKGDMEATIDVLLSMNVDNGKKQQKKNTALPQQQKNLQETTAKQPDPKVVGVESPRLSVITQPNVNTGTRNPPNSPLLPSPSSLSFNITPILPDQTPNQLNNNNNNGNGNNSNNNNSNNNNNNNNNTPTTPVAPLPTINTPTPPSSDESKLVTLRNEVLKEFQKLTSQQLSIDQQRAQINQEVAKLEQQKKEFIEQQNLFEQAKAAFSRSSSLLEASVEARKIQLEQEYKEKEAQYIQSTLREYEGKKAQSDSQKLARKEEKRRIKLAEDEAKRDVYRVELEKQRREELERFEADNEVLRLEIKSLKHSLELSERKRKEAQKRHKDILVSSYNAILEGIKKIDDEANLELEKNVDDEEDEITNLLIKNFISKTSDREEEEDEERGEEEKHDQENTKAKTVDDKDEMFIVPKEKDADNNSNNSNLAGLNLIPEEPWVASSSHSEVNLSSTRSEENVANLPPISFAPVDGDVTVTPVNFNFERDEEGEMEKSLGSLSFLPPHYTTPMSSSSTTPLFGSTLSSSSVNTNNPLPMNTPPNNNPTLFPTTYFPPTPNPPFSYMMAYNPYGYPANTANYYPQQNQGVNNNTNSNPNPNLGPNINYNYSNPWNYPR